MTAPSRATGSERRGRGARAALLLALAAGVFPACRSRRILVVESDPPGATVRLDEEIIGRTPLEHDFDFYGHRRLSLYLPGYRTWSQRVHLATPWHATFPIDIFTQVLPPLGIDHRVRFDVALDADDGIRGEPDLEAFIQSASRFRVQELARSELEAELRRRQAEERERLEREKGQEQTQAPDEPGGASPDRDGAGS